MMLGLEFPPPFVEENNDVGLSLESREDVTDESTQPSTRVDQFNEPFQLRCKTQ